ncbi:hypothetical protein E2C01_018500 [Portunus trituberculatus]|uniref:Uncharacterized protein n=1 Tax=Portunus trituberculatus TaxID=210409 RepID=A0A5B7DV77_PORTR|nr:hypothetical protein [Portunus trituberculatus]
MVSEAPSKSSRHATCSTASSLVHHPAFTRSHESVSSYFCIAGTPHDPEHTEILTLALLLALVLVLALPLVWSG